MLQGKGGMEGDESITINRRGKKYEGVNSS